MIWPGGSNRFCFLPSPCKGTSSRAENKCNLCHCYKQSNYKPRPLKVPRTSVVISLIWVRLVSLQCQQDCIPLQAVLENQVY